MEAKPLAWTPENVQRFWNYWSDRPDNHIHYFARQVGKGICKFIEQIGPVAGKSVLDYGAGPGYLVEQLLQRGAFVSAVEYSQPCVEELNQRFHRDRFWREAQQFDGRRLPWDDGSFDLICCLETVEHLLPEDLNVVLHELYRVLKPGGVLLVTTPNSENLRAQTVFCPECSCEFHRWQHVRRWTPESLGDHLQRIGFEPRFCEGISLHEFQPERFNVGKLTRVRFWRRLARAAFATLLDALQPVSFPAGRAFQLRIHQGGNHHLVAVVAKPEVAGSNAISANAA